MQLLHNSISRFFAICIHSNHCAIVICKVFKLFQNKQNILHVDLAETLPLALVLSVPFKKCACHNSYAITISLTPSLRCGLYPVFIWEVILCNMYVNISILDAL